MCCFDVTLRCDPPPERQLNFQLYDLIRPQRSASAHSRFGTGSRINVKLQKPDGSSQTVLACERDRGALYQVGHLAGRDSWLQGFLSGVIAALSQCLPHRSPQCSESVSLSFSSHLFFFFCCHLFSYLYTAYVLLIFFYSAAIQSPLSTPSHSNLRRSPSFFFFRL